MTRKSKKDYGDMELNLAFLELLQAGREAQRKLAERKQAESDSRPKKDKPRKGPPRK
jgi:hypothetical protein